MKRKAVKYLAAGAVLVVAIGYLAYAGLKDGWVSYHLDVDEFITDTRFHTQRVRLAGIVAEEGLVAGDGKMGARFNLQGRDHRQPVVYKGIVPDLFKVGAEVVVEGRLDPAGVFQAEILMTKCASKYDVADHDAKKARKMEKNS